MTSHSKLSNYMKTLRPINIKQSKTPNPNNSSFSEKKKELPGWDSNPRHTACQADALTTELPRQLNGWVAHCLQYTLYSDICIGTWTFQVSTFLCQNILHIFLHDQTRRTTKHNAAGWLTKNQLKGQSEW